ncbi:hypothetical protein QBC43DRAFT_319261 [Cladorrhinum sp. PSN259]|nr:hypothetical protein QBC43DRAFT_319261 [Cladorrhinum sp. PSN259]
MAEPRSTSRSASLSIPLPYSQTERIYISLGLREKAITVFLTTATEEEAASGGAQTPLGSFVYGMPDKYNPTQPLSTALCTVEPTIEFATRLAKLIARKKQMPVYVGNSISFRSTGLGGSVEEEMEGFGVVVRAVLGGLKELEEEEEERNNINGLEGGLEG